MRLSRFWITKCTFITLAAVCLTSCNNNKSAPPDTQNKPEKTEEQWLPPSISSLGDSERDQLIKYGRELISSTAYYLGPKGKVARVTNGMNCQNCHLDAGTKAFGNNYSAVAANYPKYRDRSGGQEDIYKRVNDCVERSLNGKALDTTSKEMQAIRAYIEWVGKDVKKGVKPTGAGLTELAFLDQAADKEKGKLVYTNTCQRCHGNNGQGELDSTCIIYKYPPLWGEHSYNTGAGLYRLSRFAGYVKSNMPLGINYDHPQISDEDAWNVAAFANSQPRPAKDVSKDYPKIATKPVDDPFGPYADIFSVKQHKYGPFLPIAEYKKKMQSGKN